jgi:hypothetical protein
MVTSGNSRQAPFEYGLRMKQWFRDWTIVFTPRAKRMPYALKAWLRAATLVAWTPYVLMILITFTVDVFIPRCAPWLFTSANDGFRLARFALYALPLCLCYVFWRARRIRRLVETHMFLLCLQCGYPLHGLGPNGQCPECGAQYEFGHVENEWKRWFGAR